MELGCLPVSNSVAVPKVSSAIDEDGKPQNEQIVAGLDNLVTQLEWWATAAKNHRQVAGVPK